jgi:alkaline phosphatase D
MPNRLFAESCALLLCWLSLCGLSVEDGSEDYGQFAPPDAFENGSTLAYYGSENEWSRRQFEASKVAEQPNRLGQRLILAIQDGRPNIAGQWCEKYLEKDPRQLEALFALAAAQAQSGDIDKAFATMQRAVAGGMPIERFIAGPRDLLAPLTSSKAFRSYLADHPVQLVHGPMLGAMTGTSVRFWVRTADEAEVTVRVFKHIDGAANTAPVKTASARSVRSMDYTGAPAVTGLEPATEYDYELLVAGKPALAGKRPIFHTFPARGSPGKWRIAFGGCAAYVPEHERMWDMIASFHPLAMLMLGDNVYIDLAEKAGPLHRYTYYQRQSRPEFRRLTQSVPVFAVWDDHDAAIDDVWLGPHRDKPSWKPSMLQLQKENWLNPSYGDPEWPGCWFQFSIGTVDFFMLDCRYYRTNPFGKDRTMLGPVQKAWLKKGLKDSKAVFKVIASSVAWASGAKPGSRDTWDGFSEEREEIFSLIEDNSIDGVVLLSADRHRSEAWKIPRPNGYALFDLMSARLTNIHTHELVPGPLFAYNAKCSFGLLSFDTQAKDPTVTYQIVNIDGDDVHTLKISKSELTMPAKRKE